MERLSRTGMFALLVAALLTIAMSIVVSALFLVSRARIDATEAAAATAQARLISGMADRTSPAAAALMAGGPGASHSRGAVGEADTLWLATIIIDGDGRQLAGPRVLGSVAMAGGREPYAIRLRVAAAAPDDGDGAADFSGVAAPIRSGGVVVVGRRADGDVPLGPTLLIWFLGGVGLIGLAAFFAVRWSSQAAERRVGEISAAIERIMDGDLSQRLPYTGDRHSGDELDRLAGEVNRMLERIERLLASLRDVSDNIAHDLKTPLNRLRTRLEGTLRTGTDPASLAVALERTIDDADDIIRTFDALLLVARLEAKAVKTSATDVDVGQVLEDLAELYEPVASEQGIELAVTGGDGVVIVSANRQLLMQAVTNLVENALKYGCDNDAPRITLSCSAAGDRISVSVSDNGQGIAAEDRELALRRFARLDPSRSRTGSGLGLALVAAVAELHGGRIVLGDAAPGLRATIELPVGGRRLIDTTGCDGVREAVYPGGSVAKAPGRFA